ncbi:MAG TPA: GNAT family N-acetyltransferase [Caulobacteraceae bacterium]|nr:GNAT family N-acetyltransferase [Caulobacteraceae bacterium]
MTTAPAVIRPAWGADLASLRRVDPRLADPARARIASNLLGQGRSWIADIAGAPAGFALTSLGFFNRPMVELLVVAEEHRRKGIGLILLNHCEAVHTDDRIFASTNASNTAANALLAKAGFEGSGIVYNIDPGDPELIYVRRRATTLTFIPYRP